MSRYREFKKTVADCYHSALKPHERVQLNDILEREVGFSHPAPFDGKLADMKKAGAGDSELACALYFLAKKLPRYRPFLADIESVLRGDYDVLPSAFSWNVGLFVEASEHPNPRLSQPVKTGQSYHYTSTDIEILGRERERSALRRFRDEGNGFRWWQIAGVAGQGKSRLALDLVRNTHSNRPNWEAGYMSAEELSAFADHWQTWTPTRPYLIVVDYVLTAIAPLKKAIQTLASRQDLPQPVRLLLLERQPWNLGDFDKDMSSNRADWYCRISARPTGHDATLDAVRFRGADNIGFNDLIEVCELEPVKLVEIVRRVAADSGRETDISSETIQDMLRRIDQKGRPLFAYFLGKAIGFGCLEATKDSRELLNWVLANDQNRRWEPIAGSDYPAPHVGSVAPKIKQYDGLNPAMHLAVLATMVNGINCNDVPFQSDWMPHNREVLRQARIFTDGPLVENPSPEIPPLQPHLLGEWFVLQTISRQRAFLELVDMAWSLKPDEMAAFLVRLAADFPREPVTERLLSRVPEGEPHEAYSSVVCDVLTHLDNAGVDFPAPVIELVKELALAGNPRAMRTLGFCFERGKGVAPDPKTAVKWYRQGAKAGDPVAMNNLGAMYHEGKGVSQNYAISMDWYEKAVAAGNDRAMGNIGVCYERGLGVEKNPSLAVEWYQRGANAGSEFAMMRLGICYERGIGIAQNVQKARELYEAAAEARSGAAMGMLGLLFHKGVHVPRDLERAVEWYRKGAALGDANSMNNLGVCYDNGRAVREDAYEAFNWYQKSADAGFARGMKNLGVCYDHARGVDQDFELAIEWYKKAADLGDEHAITNLGVCYSLGKGVNLDKVVAFSLFQTSAALGDGLAMGNVGDYYAEGIGGIAQSFEKALDWYQKGSDAGDARSSSKLHELMLRLGGD